MERRTFLGYKAAAGASFMPRTFGSFVSTREDTMSIQIGIAARKSIALKRPFRISKLTDLVPMANRF